MTKRNDMKRVVLWACLNLSNAPAFEIAIHGAITKQARARSFVTDPDVHKRLGIRNTNSQNVGLTFSLSTPNRNVPFLLRYFYYKIALRPSSADLPSGYFLQG